MSIFSGLFKKKIKGSLKSFRYSPGYSDMLGASHSSLLEKNAEGAWIFVTSDREEHSGPETVITYSVSPEAASGFENFIKETNFVSLSTRRKSSDFITDYSPWSFSIEFDCYASGGSSCEYFSIGEIREYTAMDRDLIKQVLAKFNALKSEKLSEVKEED